jgi:hypothetical protein
MTLIGMGAWAQPQQRLPVCLRQPEAHLLSRSHARARGLDIRPSRNDQRGPRERGEENVGIVLLSKLARVLGAHLTELVVEPAPGDKPPQRLKAGRRPTKSTSRCRTA